MTTYYTHYYSATVKPGELFPAALAPWDIAALADGKTTHNNTIGHKLRTAIDLYRINAPSDDPHRVALNTINTTDYGKRLTGAQFSPASALALIKHGFCYATVNDLCVWDTSGIRFGETVFSLGHYDPTDQLGYSGRAPAMFKDLLVVHAMLASVGRVVTDDLRVVRGGFDSA